MCRPVSSCSLQTASESEPIRRPATKLLQESEVSSDTAVDILSHKMVSLPHPHL